MHNLFNFIVLLKKDIENIFMTYLRKQRIRQAYRGKHYVHPFFILFFLMLAFLIAVIVLISKNLPAEKKKLPVQETVVVDTTFPSSATVAETNVDGDGFLEPFPIIAGMEAMKYMILADKYHRILYLLKQGQKRWGVIKTYPIAVGENEGKKQREGDKKTPEGLYFMVDKKTRTELVSTYGTDVAANYGPHAYVLNYPNRQDLKEGRGGSGI